MKSKRRVYLSREAYINYVSDSWYIYAYIYLFNKDYTQVVIDNWTTTILVEDYI